MCYTAKTAQCVYNMINSYFRFPSQSRQLYTSLTLNQKGKQISSRMMLLINYSGCMWDIKTTDRQKKTAISPSLQTGPSAWLTSSANTQCCCLLRLALKWASWRIKGLSRRGTNTQTSPLAFCFTIGSLTHPVAGERWMKEGLQLF